MPIRSSATSFRHRLGMHSRGGRHFLWRLALKMLFQRVHRAVCLVAGSVCPQSDRSIFRSAKDGEWNWIGPYIEEKSVPIARPAQTTITQEELATARRLGEKMLDQIGLDRQCVILTGAPNSFVDSPAIAMALAASLRTNSVFPPVLRPFTLAWA